MQQPHYSDTEREERMNGKPPYFYLHVMFNISLSFCLGQPSHFGGSPQVQYIIFDSSNELKVS